MDETIRIRAVDKGDWSETLQGLQPNEVKEVLAVYGADGQVAGVICESVEGKYFINGQPEVTYSSLQAAAGALVKGNT
jgi:hypothetical protein